MKRTRIIILTPISRLAIAFAAGIFFSDKVISGKDCLVCLFIYLLLSLLLMVGLYLMNGGRKILFGFIALTFAFAFGCLLTNAKWRDLDYQWSDSKSLYVGRIDGEVADKVSYVQFTAIIDNNRVLVRLFNDSTNIHVGNGDRICFYGLIRRPANLGNPYEFDYASYLLHNGINGNVFIRPDDILVLSDDKRRSIHDVSLDVRRSVISKFREWGMSGDELALLSALTVGERNLFSQEVEEDYMKSGLTHMLSISGMHVGILLLLINAVLWFMRRNVVLKIIRWMLVFALLWAYAFVSGLPPSAVRAVIMCLFLELVLFSHERRNALNIVSLAALCMLIYNPFYLFHIGFQLSFAAVISIILFYTPLMHMVNSRFKILQKINSVVAVSLSAQIGAAPLVLFYFSNFSVYFLVSNVLSSFLVLAIMAFALIGFILPFGFVHDILLLLLKSQNGISQMVSSWPMSVLHCYDFPFVDILFVYLFSITVFMYLMHKRRRYFIRLMVFAFIFVSINSLYTISSTVTPHAMIYNDTKLSYIHFIRNKRQSYICSQYPDSVYLPPRPSVKRYCQMEGIRLPDDIHESTEGPLYSRQGIVSWCGKRFCIVTDKAWRYKKSDECLDIDYLYLGKGFYGSISYLQELFRIKEVILGFSLSEHTVEAVIKECVDKGIRFVNMKERGYYKIIT